MNSKNAFKKYFNLINRFSSRQSLIKSVKVTNFCSKLKYDFTNNFDLSLNHKSIPIFRCLSEKGEILDPKYEILDKETAIKIMYFMVKVNVFDEYFIDCQRRSEISFYMSSLGEEAESVASSAALHPEDSLYPQYREQGALLYRGFTTKEMTNQLTGNYLDVGKGRQMPVHYGSNKLNFQTVSSPLSTQIPQASGAGYLFRVQKQNKVCLTYFGEGAASEGDFHAALNFAATLRSQTIFFCRNNKFAISTSYQDQYRGDGIASRGVGYGINTIRIDGNDALAVYYCIKEARKFCVEQGKPVLIEAMSYRGGDHSTSDLATKYRTDVVMKGFEDYLKSLGNPLDRFEKYLLAKKWIEESTVVTWKKEFKLEAKENMKEAKVHKKPSVKSMFEDVYEKIPKHLNDQLDELTEHLENYGEKYELHNYSKN